MIFNCLNKMEVEFKSFENNSSKEIIPREIGILYNIQRILLSCF